MGLKEELVTVDNIKTLTSTISGIGINEIVTGIVKSNVPRGNILQRICVMTGRIVIVAIINDKSKNFTDEKIDNTVDWYNEAINPDPTKENDGRASS